MNMEHLANIVAEIAQITGRLNEDEFMTVMCMNFDEYARAHKEASASKMAATVAGLVKLVNSELGAYT